MVYKTPHTNDWATLQQTTGELMSAVRVVSSIRHTLSEDDNTTNTIGTLWSGIYDRVLLTLLSISK
jgi:hypothetical protein